MIEHSYPFLGPVSTRSDYFYRFVPAYEPVHLELKRMITRKSEGRLEGITMRMYLPSTSEWRYIESLVLAFWFFGVPDGWNVGAEKAPAGGLHRLELVCWGFTAGAGMAMEITAVAVPDKSGGKETGTEGWLSFNSGEIHFMNSSLSGGPKLYRTTYGRGTTVLPLPDGKGSENMERQICKGELPGASERVFPDHAAQRYLSAAKKIFTEAMHSGETAEIV
ncbi:MAG: hypothetical protein K9L68_01435 [Spirochaetales bacterium]|nr:hypothetical protein [Spirochaetales bacterium]